MFNVFKLFTRLLIVFCKTNLSSKIKCTEAIFDHIFII